MSVSEYSIAGVGYGGVDMKERAWEGVWRVWRGMAGWVWRAGCGRAGLGAGMKGGGGARRRDGSHGGGGMDTNHMET